MHKISEKKSSGQNSQESKKTAPQDIYLSLDQALRLALQDFQKGNMLQAEQLCQQVLQMDTDNAAANHLMGVIISRQGGKVDTAVQYIKKAIQKNPQNAKFPQ